MYVFNKESFKDNTKVQTNQMRLVVDLHHLYVWSSIRFLSDL